MCMQPASTSEEVSTGVHRDSTAEKRHTHRVTVPTLRLPKGQYCVERLISKRKKVCACVHVCVCVCVCVIYTVECACLHAIQGSKNEYLVLWKGYPMEAATWEPSENIEAGLLRFALFNGNNLCQMLCALLSDSEFDDPDPPEHIGRSHAAALYIELAKSLTADRFDVFRFLFGSYNKKRLYFSDFNQRYFGPGWNQWFTDSVLGKHGHVIVFPL